MSDSESPIEVIPVGEPAQLLDPHVERNDGALIFRAPRLQVHDELFDVLASSARTQIALMNLHTGQTSGPFGTDHPHADQFFVVLEGVGQLVLSDGDVEVHPGDAGIIRAGSDHQFIGKSEHVFRTLNVYTPVAYPDEPGQTL